MREHVSLFLAVSFLLMSQGAMASSNSNVMNFDQGTPLILSLSTSSSAAFPADDIVKKKLIESIAQQSGDAELFKCDQWETFMGCSNEYLEKAVALGYYKDTLSPNSPHREAYCDIGENMVDSTISLCSADLRLIHFNFPGAEQATALELIGNKLAVVPNLEKLKNLRSLRIYNNQLSEASNVNGLENLTLLSLNRNKLTVAPDVTRLKNLRILNLSENQIEKTPAVEDLLNLEELYLHRNRLQTPPAVERLEKLTKLMLGENQLIKGPNVANLHNLRVLDLSNNQLRDMPKVGNLINLRSLRIHQKNPLDLKFIVEGLPNKTNLELSTGEISPVSCEGSVAYRSVTMDGQEVLVLITK